MSPGSTLTLGLREDRDGQLAKMEEEEEKEEESPRVSPRPRETMLRQLGEIVVTSTSRSVCSTFIGCGSGGA